MGLIPSTCAKHTICTYDTHAQIALDDPTRPSGAPGYGIRPVLALMWQNHKIFKINFLFFYLTSLGLLDNTSQRKLAHIQRLILLNYYFNSITDIPVGTFPWQYATSQYYWSRINFYFIFTFFQNTVVSMQLRKIPTLGSHTKIHHYTAHTWTQTTIVGILNRIATFAKSTQIHVFSLFR